MYVNIACKQCNIEYMTIRCTATSELGFINGSVVRVNELSFLIDNLEFTYRELLKHLVESKYDNVVCRNSEASTIAIYAKCTDFDKSIAECFEITPVMRYKTKYALTTEGVCKSFIISSRKGLMRMVEVWQYFIEDLYSVEGYLVDTRDVYKIEATDVHRLNALIAKNRFINGSGGL